MRLQKETERRMLGRLTSVEAQQLAELLGKIGGETS